MNAIQAERRAIRNVSRAAGLRVSCIEPLLTAPPVRRGASVGRVTLVLAGVLASPLGIGCGGVIPAAHAQTAARAVPAPDPGAIPTTPDMVLAQGAQVQPGPAAGGTLPPGTPQQEVNPRVVPGLVAPVPTRAEESGPLAGVQRTLGDAGISVHALFLDFGETNPSLGVNAGNYSNTGYLIVGADADTSKILGLPGGTLHFEETIFPFRQNSNMAGQIGDSQVGYQPAYTVIANQLSLLTYEQKLLNNRLDLEAGRSNPFNYFALPVCQSINSCFSSIFQNNAGVPSPQYSVYAARASYNFTPASYVEVGEFEVNPTVHTRYGYNFPADGASGALTLAELGRKTTFATDAYPGRYSLTGFYNTAQHADASQTIYGTNKALFRNEPAKMINGTSGLILEGQQIVWRADGGSTKSMNPTSLAVYGNVSLGLDSTTSLRSDVFGGVTLQSPFVGRPADRFGVKMDWERLNQKEAAFETAASDVSGGSGSRVPVDSYVFELNAHLQVISAIAFEPVVQYVVNPNDFYQPYTAHRARDGVYVGGTLIVPIGVMLGLAKL